LAETLEPWNHMLIPKDSLVEGNPFASGAFGVVSTATLEDPRTGKQTKVAVKRLIPTGESQERLSLTVGFARELNTWARVKHPNILPLVGFFLDSDAAVAMFVSPYQPYGNITTYIKTEKPDDKGRRELALDTAEGLAYLHDLPICHGDIKSQNIVINDERRAMLCDFGLATVVQANPTGLTTARFAAGGTLRYQSPELFIIEGARRNFKSDVWAWGGVLLEILTDQSPFGQCKNDTHTMGELAKGNPPASVETLPISPRLQKLLGGCWNAAPDARPEMHDCAKDLKHELAEGKGTIQKAFTKFIGLF